MKNYLMLQEKEGREKNMKKLNEVRNILIVLNSSDGSSSIDKYPMGNKELTNKTKILEHLREIEFNAFINKWIKVKK